MKWIILAAALLTGCSASSLLPVLGSKPEATIQAGAENTKQAVGVTAKSDSSTEVDTSFRDSQVGAVDTSTRKHVSASSISASTITADKIEIRNSDTNFLLGVVGIVAGVFILIVGFVLWRRDKKQGA